MKRSFLSIILILSCVAVNALKPQSPNLSETYTQAKAGNAASQRMLAQSLYYGRFIDQDSKEARIWFEKSAKQGDMEAQLWLATMYYAGEGGKQDYKKALYWYKKAAEQKAVRAYAMLALMYLYGEGVERSYQESLKWAEPAAGEEDSIALYCLGCIYNEGSAVKQDKELGKKLIARSAELGYKTAQRWMQLFGQERPEEEIDDELLNALQFVL